MQNNSGLVEEIKSLFPELTDELIQERSENLEWFIKRTAVEAVNEENKAEFQKILNENDLGALALFINKYVPNFNKMLIEHSLQN